MSAQPPIGQAVTAPTRAVKRHAPATWLTLMSVPRLFLLAGVAAVLVYAASVAVLPRRYGHIVGGDGIYYYVYLQVARPRR